jgi:AcrR family transcriptional regulator
MPQDAQPPASRRSTELAIPATWPAGPRSRVLAAVADVVDTRGYADTRVSDLLAYAHMSRRTFYGQFDNVQDCFFAAYEAVRDDALAVLEAASSPGVSTEEQLGKALDSLLGHFAQWPTHAMLLMVHVAGVGPQALAEHERTMSRLADLLTRCTGARDSSDGQSDPRLVSQAVIGALQRLVQLSLHHDPPKALTRLSPMLTAVAVRVAA